MSLISISKSNSYDPSVYDVIDVSHLHFRSLYTILYMIFLAAGEQLKKSSCLSFRDSVIPFVTFTHNSMTKTRFRLKLGM